MSRTPWVFVFDADGVLRFHDHGGELERVEQAVASIASAGELPGAPERSNATLLIPVPLWDGCPDGRIAVLDPVARKLFMLDPG